MGLVPCGHVLRLVPEGPIYGLVHLNLVFKIVPERQVLGMTESQPHSLKLCVIYIGTQCIHNFACFPICVILRPLCIHCDTLILYSVLEYGLTGKITADTLIES